MHSKFSKLLPMQQIMWLLMLQWTSLSTFVYMCTDFNMIGGHWTLSFGNVFWPAPHFQRLCKRWMSCQWFKLNMYLSSIHLWLEILTNGRGWKIILFARPQNFWKRLAVCYSSDQTGTQVLIIVYCWTLTLQNLRLFGCITQQVTSPRWPDAGTLEYLNIL